MAKENDAIKSIELRIITKSESRNNPGAGWKLRVVQYYKPATTTEAGRSIAVKLESGEYWKGDDGIERMKTKGLTMRDLEELEKIDHSTGKPVYLTVKSLMKSPPPIPVADLPGSSEVPFS